MFLSSPNCRIHAVIRHIAPYYVQSCRIMFYSKFEILWPYVEAGIFAPASTYGQLFFTRPHKNRSPFPITSPRFALLYRTSSPHIAVLKALPWQMNNTFILLILSPYIFSKPCKYWLSSLYTLFSKTAFFLVNSCIFSCFLGHFGYKWVIFLVQKALQNKAFMSYLCMFLGYKPVFIQFFLCFF